MRRFLLFTFVFLLLAGLAGGLGYFQFIVKPEMIKGFIAKAPPPMATVAVTEATTEEWIERIPAVGTFRAVQGIEVAPQLEGVIRAFHFDSGQEIAKGALLLEIDDTVEQADLKSNMAMLKNADMALDRQRQLITGGSTSRSTLDAAEAARDQASAAVERTRALISQKAIVAPFAGRIGLRRADIGQYVSKGTPIASLQQLDPIYVDFPVPEQTIAELATGQVVEVSVDAWPEQAFKGKVISLDARVSAETRNLVVRAEVRNADKRLKPGMFANVAVLVGKAQSLVTLPRTGVTYSLYGDSVYVVKPAPVPEGSAEAAPAPTDQQMIVERRAVKLGAARGSRVSILSGLAAGEQVVSEGQSKLTPGARVRVDNALALPASLNPLPRQ
jgi:membrane fusion protein (multidrug efflux system)